MKEWLSCHWFEIMLLVVSFTTRFFVYNQSRFANGWDAYFYIVQIKSYIEEGAMHSSRLSLFYPILIGIQWMINDYELTYKIASALIVSLFSWQLFRLSKLISNDDSIPFIVGMITLLSPQLTFVGSQFPKNLLGIVVFLWLVQSLIQRKYILAAILIFAGFFVHKMTAGLSLFFVIGYLLIGNRSAEVSSRWYIVFAISFVGVSLLGFLIPHLSFDWFGIGLNAPAFAGGAFINSISENITIGWKLEIYAAYFIVAFVSIFNLFKNRKNDFWHLFLPTILLLVLPILEWNVLGIAYRFLMIFVILAPLSLNYFEVKIRNSIIYFGTIITCLWAFWNASSFPLQKLDPPYRTYQNLTNKISRFDAIDPELIIMHKSFAEYFTFKTGKDALPWEPEYEIATNKLWRVAWGISQQELRYFATEAGFDKLETIIYQLDPWYLYVREDVWDASIAIIKEEDSELFEMLMTWKNPHEIRPGYLLKKMRFNHHTSKTDHRICEEKECKFVFLYMALVDTMC